MPLPLLYAMGGSTCGFPGGKLPSEAKLMRNAGGKLRIPSLYQAWNSFLVLGRPSSVSPGGLPPSPRGRQGRNV